MLFEFQLSDKNKYTCLIKQYKKAKSVKLRRTKTGDLVLSLPKKFYYSKGYLTKLMQQQESWILETQKRFDEMPTPTFPEPPQSIKLEALGEEWLLEYPPSGEASARLIVDNKQQVLKIQGVSSNEDIAALVRKFVSKKAKQFLSDRLKFCCAQYGFEERREQLRITFARTRWGSYSKKTISLNARLIFLPVELVDYVIVHELCHATFLNHSEDYYKMLSVKMPNHKELKKQIHELKLGSFLWAL